MTANFNVRKIYSAVERMDGCEYSLEIIIVLLKEHITETNFFLEINILLLEELLKQWMAARFLVKLNTLSLKQWMTATLYVTKTVYLKEGMAVIRVVK